MDDYQVLNAKHHEREGEIIDATPAEAGAITIATNMAGRVCTDIKLGGSPIVPDEYEAVKALGGLYVMGTERHESRRIDNQLRGRAGRQGDPGTTRFYVSLEDDVARLFGGDRVKKLLNMMGSNEEIDAEPLSQKMVSNSIERAQRQVEEHNFEMRKHVLEYDEVMDKQRKYIYGMRAEVLQDQDVTERLEQMVDDHVADLVAEYTPKDVDAQEWDPEGLLRSIKATYAFDADPGLLQAGDSDEVHQNLKGAVLDEYRHREQTFTEELREAYKDQIGGDDARIDFDAIARQRTHGVEMSVILKTVDDRWVDYLREMDFLRESVRLRAMGQRDPLLEYKQEGFEMFQELVRSIEEGVLQTLYHLTDPETRRRRERKAKAGTLTQSEDPYAQLQDYQQVGGDKQDDRSFSAYDEDKYALAGQSDAASGNGRSRGNQPERKKPEPRRVEKTAKPNDPCPCGSGKKYKKCCGRAS